MQHSWIEAAETEDRLQAAIEAGHNWLLVVVVSEIEDKAPLLLLVEHTWIAAKAAAFQ